MGILLALQVGGQTPKYWTISKILQQSIVKKKVIQSRFWN